MPRINRPPKPVPDPIYLQRFLDAMEEARREDIAEFKGNCTTDRALVRRLGDGSIVAIIKQQTGYKLSVSSDGTQTDCNNLFDSMDDAIWQVIRTAEECEVNWRLDRVECCCPVCMEW